VTAAEIKRLGVVPIDEAAQDGSYQLVFAEGRFALVRWATERWVFPSGRAWPLSPSHYRPQKDPAHA